MDVIIIGAGPAGVFAARRAAELGAKTTLITRDEFGGMGATDGPVPVRTLAHAARLIREARQLGQYGIAVSEPMLEYPRLLARVREVVTDVRTFSLRREDMDRLGVTVHEKAGTARFVDPHTIETESGLRLQADKIILCAGGMSRRLSVPGFELTATHSDAWSANCGPAVDVGHRRGSDWGAGRLDLQRVWLTRSSFSRPDRASCRPRTKTCRRPSLPPSAGRASWCARASVPSNRLRRRRAACEWSSRRTDTRDSAEAALAVVAVGWVADSAGLNLATAGVETDARGYVRVDSSLRTSAPHVYAAGDITGRLMLVPQAIQDGFVAATNAVRGATTTLGDLVSPIGSFTDPEYAQVGLTEAKARETHDAVVAVVRFDETTRTIIDGRTAGFCKLIADRATCAILGCHVVGERAVEIVQVVAIAIAAGMRVDDLARVPLSFPTYASMPGRAAYRAAQQLNLEVGGQVSPPA